MAGRNRSNMAGLLKKLFLALLLFAAAFPAAAQDASADNQNLLAVLTETYPENPMIGETWIFNILIDHPDTNDVTVDAPRFPQSMRFERMRTGTLFYGHAAAGPENDITGSRWTHIEYSFSLRSAGTFTLEPFVISAGDRRGATNPFTLRVAAGPGASAAARPLPFLRWENTAVSFISGLESELTLALHNWDTAKPLPRSLLQGRVPEGFVMEELPFTGAAGDTVIRYPIRVIALETGRLVFGPLSVQVEDENLVIPELNIPVIANPRPVPADISASIPWEETPPEVHLQEVPLTESHYIPFQESIRDVFPLFRKAYSELVTEAQSLWDQGLRAQALALVRANERDSLLGPSFISIRRTMENAAGLTETGDENWRFPFRLILITGGLFFVLFSGWALIKNISKQKNSSRRTDPLFPEKTYKQQDNTSLVTFNPLKGLIYIISQLVLAGVGAVLIHAGLAGFFGNKEAGRYAVLSHQAEAFRVPGSTAGHALFAEGQAVRIFSSASSWSFVESAGGKSGWVETGALIIY